MKKRVAIFPFDEFTLPIVRHFSCLQDSYILQHAIAWNGSGLVGKDVAYVSNQPTVGVTVTNEFDAMSQNWDVLIVNCSNINYDLCSPTDTENLFRKFLDLQKKILFVTDGTDSSAFYSHIHADYPDNVTLCVTDPAIGRNAFDGVKYRPISVPVMLVGGLTETSDTLEIILSLKEQFNNCNRKISCISGSNMGTLLGVHSYSHIFCNNSLTESEKVLRLNQFARAVIETERPELVIVEAPDPIMKFSNIAPNGFGIRTYMICQALDPNLFVCCMPSELVNEHFINQVSNGISNKLGFGISAVHSTNILVDSMTTLQDQTVSCLHVDMESVSRSLQNIQEESSIYICNVNLQGSEGLYLHISNLMEQGV